MWSSVRSRKAVAPSSCPLPPDVAPLQISPCLPARRVESVGVPFRLISLAPTPKASVRQTWSQQLAPARPTILKVRAFDEWFDRGSGTSALQIKGQFKNNLFVVSVSSCRPTQLHGKVLHDAAGAYALLDMQQHSLAHGLALRVEADAQDQWVDIASISCFEIPQDSVAETELCNAARWYSVYFNPLGHSDGVGTGGPFDSRLAECTHSRN